MNQPLRPVTFAQRMRILAKAGHHLSKACSHLFRAIGMLRLLGEDHRHRMEALSEAMGSGGELTYAIRDELAKAGACRSCGLTGNVHDAQCKKIRRDADSDSILLKRFVLMVQGFEQTGELHLQEEQFAPLPDVADVSKLTPS